MEDSSDSEKNKSCPALISSDPIEDSGYSSNLSEFSESFPHISPINICTPLFGLSKGSAVKHNGTKSHQDFALSPSKRIRYDSSSSFQDSPYPSTDFVNLGKRGSINEDFENSSSIDVNLAKKFRGDCDGSSNSCSKNGLKEAPKSAEPKFFVSTPYSDFIDKLKYSPSPVVKTNLIGRSHVDFLYFLGVKNIHNPVLQRIFSYLSDQDLYTTSRVCKTWHHLIMNNDACSNRINNFLLKPMKENVKPSSALQKLDENTELPPSLVRRVRLIEIQNRTGDTPNAQNQNRGTTTNKSPPVSPSKVRFHLFQKEGQKLDPGEQLVQCPRCSLPSRQDKANNSGSCTRQGCQYQFCLSCYREFQQPHTCSLLTPRYSSKSGSKINSKASRKFLRRL